jgi:hypothetical protein
MRGFPVYSLRLPAMFSEFPSMSIIVHNIENQLLVIHYTHKYGHNVIIHFLCFKVLGKCKVVFSNLFNVGFSENQNKVFVFF